MTKIVDLTHSFTKCMPVHSLDEPASIKKIRTLADNKYNDWTITSSMHIGTHIDGPGHLTDSKVLISEIFADRLFGKGYLIDARNKTIDASLLKSLPAREGLIVLILTGSDKKFGTKEYFDNHPVICADFAQELVKHKIKMVGIDFFSPDNYPFQIHKIFFERDVLIIENLTNLESLLNVKNFAVVALPLKTETDSALARVVAILEDKRSWLKPNRRELPRERK